MFPLFVARFVVAFNAALFPLPADRPKPAPVPATTVTIQRAVYGVRNEWVDAEAVVKRNVLDGHPTPVQWNYFAVRDPAPNIPKTLVVDFQVNNLRMTVTVPDGGSFMISKR